MDFDGVNKSDESPQASGIRNFRPNLAVMTELRIANRPHRLLALARVLHEHILFLHT
jgi:hypothetical protein